MAHARRTNPRTRAGESVHGAPLRLPRILRRGFSYGPVTGSSSKAPRGLMFMAYNASIAEQFEVLQRWINGGNSTGVASSHADPIVSHASPRVIRLLDAGEPRHLMKRRPFVTLKWGLYLFAPSIPGLRMLAERAEGARAAARAREIARDADRGAQIIGKLRVLERLEQTPGYRTPPGAPSAEFAWKLALGDRAARDEARAIWAAVRRDHGGVLRTAYGVLVASSAGVRQVLSDESAFSVREYWHRMRESVGALHLGMDRCPRPHARPRPKDAEYEREVSAGAYDAASKEPNAFIYQFLDRRSSLELARRESAAVFARLQGNASKAPAIVNLRDFGALVVNAVSRQWFGLPVEDAEFALFQTAALTIFQPNPEPAVRASARLNQPAVERASQAAAGSGCALARHLAQQDFTGSVPTALVGGTQGFLAATVGSFLSVLNQWLESDRLPRLRAWLLSQPGQNWLAAQAPGEPRYRACTPAESIGVGEENLIEAELLAALSRAPAPDLLHRTATIDVPMEGGETIRASDTVVISIASALAETPGDIDLLFGGPYSSTKQPGAFIHACPGKEAALGVILGMLVELLGRDLRREGPLRVSVREQPMS